MKLYTRGGDDGTTGLPDGRRVSKSDKRIAAFGDVDETNAAIGLAAARCRDDELLAVLRSVQSDLFVLGAQLAGARSNNQDVTLGEAAAARIEGWIDKASDETPPLRSFILPGGSETAAGLHAARAACRRAERTTVELARAEAVDKDVLVYLNRLSDLLFALARQANHRAGVADIPWTAPEGK